MRLRHLGALCLLSSFPGLAADGNPGDLDLRLTGYSFLDAGYIHETQDQNADTWESQPFGSITAGLRLTARPGERLLFVLNPELKSNYGIPQRPGNINGGEQVQKARWEIYVEETKFLWDLGRAEPASMQLGLGHMLYKENPDSRIFGDYLFRSMIYPSLLFTKFNSPKAPITGLHFRHGAGGFRQDAFVLSETRYYPYFDVSLAYTARYTYRNLFEVGAGVNFRSVLPVRPSRTTPAGGEGEGVMDNTYKFVPLQDSTAIRDASNNVIKTISVVQVPGTDSADILVNGLAEDRQPIVVYEGRRGVQGLGEGLASIKSMRSLTIDDRGIGDLLPELDGDNVRYSFAGQLFMARAAYNPLGFLEKHRLGRDAFKVYAEAALLGLKNYPIFYEKRRERIPIMAGIHLPTFGALDFLAVEVEHFPSRLMPTYEMRFGHNVPQPGVFKAGSKADPVWKDPERAAADDWKWGVAAKRSFRGFALVAQAGTDHTKMINEDGKALWDILTRPAHWYAQVRFIGGVY